MRMMRMSKRVLLLILLGFVFMTLFIFLWGKGSSIPQMLPSDNRAVKVIIEPHEQKNGHTANTVYEYQAGSDKASQILKVLSSQTYRYSFRDFVNRAFYLDSSLTVSSSDDPGYSVHILISENDSLTGSILLAGSNEILSDGHLLYAGNPGKQEELALMNEIFNICH